MTAPLPDVFDEHIVAPVADETAVDESAVVEGVVAVQSVVTGPGELTVDDIVYEWRTQHHKDPLVSRTPDAYYLDVREHVWTDIADRGAISTVTLEAVREVHRRQFAADTSAEPPSGAMVLARAE